MLTAQDLVFDPVEHIYRKPDGSRVLSVTGILKASGASTDFGALGQVSPRLAAQIGLKRDIGAALHADTHAYDDGDLDWDSVDPMVLPYLHAWTVVRANLRLMPLVRERIVYHPELDYTGTLDGIFRQEHTGLIILPDLKIGDPADAAAEQQTAAYEAAYRYQFPEQRIDERWSIQLTPKRRIPYRVTNYTAMPNAWQHFEDFKQNLDKVRKETVSMPTDPFTIDPDDIAGPGEFQLEPEEDGPADPNAHGIGPDTDGGPNPDYVAPAVGGLFAADEQGDIREISLGEAMAGMGIPPEPELRVMDVLPADFPLPALVRFVPKPELKAAVEKAHAYAATIVVAEKGVEAIERADLALAALNAAVKAVEAEFKEPCDVAFQLHRHLTGTRAAWIGESTATAKRLGAAIYAENERLKAVEAAARRKEQDEANRKERERLRQEAEAAAAASAPANVVEALEKKAATATAPPVAASSYGGGRSYGGSASSNTTVETWKAAPSSTPDDAENLNPTAKEMTAEQAEDLKNLAAAVGRGEQPYTLIEPNYAALNPRAKSDGAAMSIPGFKAVKRGGTRSKPGRKS